MDFGRPLPRTGSSAQTKVERITQYAARLIRDERNMGMGIISILTNRSLGLCIGKSAQPICRYFPDINIGSRAKRGGGAAFFAIAKNATEPKTPPRLVRGLAGGAAGGKKDHAIWLHFPSKSGNNIDYRIVE